MDGRVHAGHGELAGHGQGEDAMQCDAMRGRWTTETFGFGFGMPG